MGDPATDALDADQDEHLYKWMVRGLYLTLLAANVYILLDAYKNTTDMLVLRAKLRRWWEGLKDCEDCARRRDALRRATNRMLWHAERAVEGEEP